MLSMSARLPGFDGPEPVVRQVVTWQGEFRDVNSYDCCYNRDCDRNTVNNCDCDCDVGNCDCDCDCDWHSVEIGGRNVV